MVERIQSYPISVIIEHIDDRHRPISVGSFEWPEGAARETYTIALDKYTSLRLDAHFPARPNSISVADAGVIESRSIIEAFVGDDIAESLIIARAVGAQAIESIFLKEQSLAIARLQLISPNTPRQLRNSCRVLLDSQPDTAQYHFEPGLYIPTSTNGGPDVGDANLSPAA